MSKYARFTDCSSALDGSDVRTIDVVDTDAYNPKPAWFTDDASFLERLYSPELVAQWKAVDQWFVTVPGGVQAGARFSGNDHSDVSAYLNPDGSNGNGEFPPPPMQAPEEPAA